MKMTEARELSPDQLAQRVHELRQELFNLRFQYATRQLTNVARIRQVRHDVARLQTRQRELELQRAEA